jgi:NTE family protein
MIDTSKLHNFCTLLLCLLSFNHLSAQDNLKVGLALSGGGAKGFAHIGLIQVSRWEKFL